MIYCTENKERTPPKLSLRKMLAGELLQWLVAFEAEVKNLAGSLHGNFS